VMTHTPLIFVWQNDHQVVGQIANLSNTGR
jgi:hypothetical protein